MRCYGLRWMIEEGYYLCDVEWEGLGMCWSWLMILGELVIVGWSVGIYYYFIFGVNVYWNFFLYWLIGFILCIFLL